VQALLKTDVRTANVVAESDDVECLSLDRESFFQLVGELDELRDKDYEDQKAKSRKGGI
jgi:cGMP-dependent protein kinase